MIDILIGSVVMLCVVIGILFVIIGDLKKEIAEVTKTQHVQDEDIYELMKSHMNIQDTLYQHSEVISYLAEQDPLIGKQKILYPTIVGKA